jgi:hypothetical protein
VAEQNGTGAGMPTLGAGFYFSGAAIMAAILWGWFLLERFTSLRLVGSSGIAHEEPVHILFPTIGTAVCLLGALFLWRRAAGMAANGVPVGATVTAVGGEFQGMRDVSFSYVFEGTELAGKISVPAVSVKDLEPGGEFRIIVDKRNPKRYMQA